MGRLVGGRSGSTRFSCRVLKGTPYGYARTVRTVLCSACPTDNDEGLQQIGKLEEIDALAVQNGRRFSLPRTMSSATAGAEERNSKSTLPTNDRLNNSKNQDRYTQDPGASGRKAQNENSVVVQKSDRWQYSLPLAVGVIFVLLLGWLLMRRG